MHPAKKEKRKTINCGNISAIRGDNQALIGST